MKNYDFKDLMAFGVFIGSMSSFGVFNNLTL